MALSVVPVNNPSLVPATSVPTQTISSVGVAVPGQNGAPTLVQPKAPAAPVSAAVSANNSLQDQTNALLAQIQALTNAQQRQVYAPALDFAAINSQARAAAESNVDPYYTKQLNDFLAEQAAKTSQEQASAATNIQDLQDTLTNTLAANQTAGQRAAEDTATNEDQINTQADQFQTDNGQQFTADRLAQAKDLASKGLTGGLGAQQEEASAAAHDTTEERAAATTDAAKQAQELLKSRTFEDLATSGNLATTAENKGEKAVNVSLADFITNSGFDTTNEENTLESQRLQAVATEQSNQAKLLVNNFINSIADPAKRQAAVQAYGGAF